MHPWSLILALDIFCLQPEIIKLVLLKIYKKIWETVLQLFYLTHLTQAVKSLFVDNTYSESCWQLIMLIYQDEKNDYPVNFKSF